MYIYTVTLKSTIEGIFTNGWSKQFAGDAEGVDYGVGVYGNINYPYQEDKTPYKSIGRYRANPSEKCIIKSRLVGGLRGFLLFDEIFASKVYGENHSIKDQVYAILPKEAADSLWKDMQWYILKDRSAEGNGNHMRGRTSGLLQYMMSKRFHRDVANPEKFESLFAKYNIRGAIYTGRADGLCIVAYNYDEVIPIAFSLDGGKTYKEKQLKFNYPDSVRRYKHLYRKVEFPIALQGEDKIYYFSKVQVKDGKWNYIDATNNQKISDTDFDSCTSINPNDGMFQIEYNGVFYNACPDGFYDENGEGHTWDELPEFGSDGIDDEIDNIEFNEEEKKFDKILTESINKILKEYICYYNILNEDVSTNNGEVDEISYYHYDVPDMKYFDSPSVPSIYHCTHKESVNSIFKFGFDREFLKTFAYGKGVYAAYDVNNGKNQLGDTYGHVMLQLKLIGGYDRFLFFATNPNIERIARKYYGDKISILDQLKTFLPCHIAEDIYNKCGNDVRAYSNYATKYHIRGAVYQWGHTIAVLPYDFSSAVPYAASFDYGKTFKKMFNNDTWERFLTNVDVEWRYGNKYKKIDKAILGLNVNGEKTGYAKVQKNNGKWNYIDIQTGQEQMPLDFESLTTMDTETGMFQAEYNGFILNACLDGFIDDNGEGHTWDELDTYLLNQNNDDDDDLKGF